MSSPVESRSVTIGNENGLHMRPARLIAETAAQFESQIEIVKDDKRIDGKSVLLVMTLFAPKGTELHFHATGPDAANAVETLANLVQSGFDEITANPNDDSSNAALASETKESNDVGDSGDRGDSSG